MTTLVPPAPSATVDASAAARALGTPRLLAGLDRASALDLRTHLAVHGPLVPPDRERLVAWPRAVALAGRGGAGFPLADKIDALAPGAPCGRRQRR